VDVVWIPRDTVDPGDQQVVDVAAVTGYVNDFVFRGQFLETTKMMKDNTVINFVPEPG
jgi:hypothetical protein